jgi:type II secretion system protein H
VSRGFTLIELAVAVVIACIATAIALPSLTPSSPQVRLDGDAAALAGMVRSARQYAVLARRPTGVRVTESGAHALRWDGAAWQPLPGHALAAARFANSDRVAVSRASR